MSLVTMEDFEICKQIYTGRRYDSKGKGNAKLAYVLSRLSTQERGDTCEHLIAAEMQKRDWKSRVTARKYPYDINSYKNGSRLHIEVKSALLQASGAWTMQAVSPWHDDGEQKWDVLVMCCVCPVNGVVVRAAHHSDVVDFLEEKTENNHCADGRYNIYINKHYDNKKLDLYAFDDIIKFYEPE